MGFECFQMENQGDPSGQQEYWDKVALEKEFTIPVWTERFSQLVPKAARILDYGCGYGRTLHELSGLGYENLKGFDFSPKMIQRGQTLYPELDLRFNEDTQLPCPEHSVDVVLLLAVLTCIIDDADQIQLMKEFHRILRPGGILHVNDFLLNQDPESQKRYDRFASSYPHYGTFEIDNGGVVRHHDEKWVQQLFQESGFSTIAYESTTFMTMNGNLRRGFRYFGRKPV